MKTKIFLLRHGVTSANKEKRFAGRTDEPLHPDGIEQFKRVAENLRHKTIAKIFCGPLPRTMESAKILGAITESSVQSVEPLNEISIPHWDGLTKLEIRDRFGNEYPTWLKHPSQFYSLGCETISQVQKRAVTEVESIMAINSGKCMAVVSHLIVIRSIILHYQKLDLNNFRKITINNGDLTTLTRYDNGETTITCK